MNQFREFLTSRKRSTLPLWKELLFTLLICTIVIVPMEAMLFGLAAMRAKMYAAEVQQCEASGGTFHCLHGMCHCHGGSR